MHSFERDYSSVEGDYSWLDCIESEQELKSHLQRQFPASFINLGKGLKITAGVTGIGGIVAPPPLSKDRVVKIQFNIGIPVLFATNKRLEVDYLDFCGSKNRTINRLSESNMNLS